METPKKIPYISGNWNPKKASYISGNGTFQFKPPKIKKIHPEKNSLYFGKWNFLRLTGFLYFLQRKLFLYFLKKATRIFQPRPLKFSLKKFLIFFPKKSASKKFLIFSQKSPSFCGNWNPEKIFIFQERKFSYISGDGIFFYFKKRNFLILPETELSYILQEMELSYISGNGTFLYFRK